MISELLETLGTAARSENTGGSTTGWVYTAELLITQALDVELYNSTVTSDVCTSNLGAATISVNARKTGSRWEMSWASFVTERLPWGNVARSKRVTTPKLLAPPFRARYRSLLDVWLALVRVPSPRTTWNELTLALCHRLRDSTCVRAKENDTPQSSPHCHTPTQLAEKNARYLPPASTHPPQLAHYARLPRPGHMGQDTHRPAATTRRPRR